MAPRLCYNGTAKMSGDRIDYSIKRRPREKFVGCAGLLARLDQLLVDSETDRWRDHPWARPYPRSLEAHFAGSPSKHTVQKQQHRIAVRCAWSAS